MFSCDVSQLINPQVAKSEVLSNTLKQIELDLVGKCVKNVPVARFISISSQKAFPCSALLGIKKVKYVVEIAKSL